MLSLDFISSKTRFADSILVEIILSKSCPKKLSPSLSLSLIFILQVSSIHSLD